MKVTVEREVGGRTLSLTTGEVAKQAGGAVFVQLGETVVLVATVSGSSRPGTDFFPLTCDYRERTAAAGKFPGGFYKREGRPSMKEILTSRLTDRPIRPLFPEGYIDEVQVMSTVLACDPENEPDVLSIIGASAALCLAPVPFQGPIAAVRVGLVNDEFVSMPTQEQIGRSRLDLVVAGSANSVLMIEGFADQLPEPDMLAAIGFAQREIAKICELQQELMEKAGRKPSTFQAPAANPFAALVNDRAYAQLKTAKAGKPKKERHEAARAIRDAIQGDLFPNGAVATAEGHTLETFKRAFSDLEYQVVRDLILEGVRLDGRKPNELRQVTCKVGILPRVHGSALFTRGETQSLATITLGTVRDQQKVDGLFEEYSKRFMLDYNFPPYSVGECRPLRGPGRREIGHGALAERSVNPVIPAAEKFPYTIRTISDITESNGSSSMASVCSATLSLMDAGVPLTQPVAGISIGLVKQSDDKFTLLTDIIGDEDHYGDMDFKVAGTQKGITGIQLDLKISGISERIIRETLEQARLARIELLRAMLSVIPRPRREVAETAPRLKLIKIDPEKIGLLIGPGGKTVRGIQENSGAQIDIAEDGTVTISGRDLNSVDLAMASVEALTEEIKPGRIYEGTVSSIKDFGAFIEIAPGKDGLCHISELAEGYVKSVLDICKVGDRLRVKVIAVDDQNRVKLSRKAVIADERAANGDVGAE